MSAAGGGRSLAPRDAWLSLAGPVEDAPGAAALFTGGAAGRGATLWCAVRRPFGLAELGSTALAGAVQGAWGRGEAGLHVLEADPWREWQWALRWSPPLPGEGLQWALGLEERRQSAGGWATRGWWPLADFAWTLGPLAAQARLQAPAAILAGQEGGRSALETRLALGWRLDRGWGAAWSQDCASGQARDQVALVWRRPGGGLAAAWMAGRGWEVAARAEWRGLALAVAWWSHPVLPPTTTWSLDWGLSDSPAEPLRGRGE